LCGHSRKPLAVLAVSAARLENCPTVSYNDADEAKRSLEDKNLLETKDWAASERSLLTNPPWRAKYRSGKNQRKSMAKDFQYGLPFLTWKTSAIVNPLEFLCDVVSTIFIPDTPNGLAIRQYWGRDAIGNLFLPHSEPAERELAAKLRQSPTLHLSWVLDPFPVATIFRAIGNAAGAAALHTFSFAACCLALHVMIAINGYEAER
jgi:hypothetical protein